MIKSLYISYGGNFISKGNFVVNNAGVTNDGTYFTFPTNTSHLYSVKLNPETGLDDIHFKFKLALQNVVAASKVGILLKSATDNVDAEAPSFQIGNGKISYYWGDTKLVDFVNFDITPYNNQEITLEFWRQEEYYYLKFQGKIYKRQSIENGTYFKQNVKACVYGSNVNIKIVDVNYFTDYTTKFVILGDSILNGYAPTGAVMPDTVRGILALERGISIHEACGDANVIKDSLDSFNDIIHLRPQYGIIFYGHNDTYFNTGRLQSDYIKLVSKLKSLGITPIICSITQSTWIDVNIPNTFIINNFFNDNYLHIDLRTVLTAPTDFIDGLHPTIAGNRKLADAIYASIQSL